MNASSCLTPRRDGILAAMNTNLPINDYLTQAELYEAKAAQCEAKASTGKRGANVHLRHAAKWRQRAAECRRKAAIEPQGT